MNHYVQTDVYQNVSPAKRETRAEVIVGRWSLLKDLVFFICLKRAAGRETCPEHNGRAWTFQVWEGTSPQYGARRGVKLAPNNNGRAWSFQEWEGASSQHGARRSEKLAPNKACFEGAVPPRQEGNRPASGEGVTGPMP